jgi:ribose 5-phosphate isomerase B|tara:strand:- start:114 stop:542 length:429 start_codon:yes stop_codon:yes gene_type:complete
MKISIASDHAGFELKTHIINHFKEIHTFIDSGPDSNKSVDYPDFAHKAVSDYLQYKCHRIILICGSGNGIQMSANKHKNIRCALCWTSEITKMARLHNDANALALPARFISFSDAFKFVNIFIDTPFEGGRHQKRISKINGH